MAVDQYAGHKSLTGHWELTHLRKSKRKESFYKKIRFTMNFQNHNFSKQTAPFRVQTHNIKNREKEE